MHCKNSMRNL